ncbi:MAG TPA: alpha/beta fold hydrolase [Thermoanaerobaculia bacterium]|nr:alpha/beta fold hydrolase [Thermoanaerobaculia bacterium]
MAAFLVTSPVLAQPPERVILDDLGRLPSFSHATVVGDLVFVSGTLGTRPGSDELVDGGVREETRQTLRNIARILEGAGTSLDRVAKCNVYLVDLADFPVMNETYLEFFGERTGQDPPARTTVGVASLVLGAAVEIECIASRGLVAAPVPRPRLDRPLMQESGFVESAGERIYWESTGDGEALVLAHGLGGNHAIWFQQVPELAARFRVITWDSRGFGRSTRTTGELGFAASARDLLAVLDHLEVERAHVVGQSMGGWIALRFALDHPERTRSLVLADSPGGISSPELLAIFDRLAAEGRTPQAMAGVPIDRHPALDDDLGRRDPVRAFLYRAIGSVAPNAPAEMGALMRNTTVADTELRRLAMPVLFLVGTEDAIFPPGLIRAAAARVPGARVVEIPGAGHSPYFEMPEAWNRVVATFLQETPSPE